MMYLFIFISVLVVFFFFFTDSLIASLINLCLFTLSVGYLSYSQSLNFWSLGLLVIAIITGLFIAFAYIVSLNPQPPQEGGVMWNLILTAFSGFFSLTLTPQGVCGEPHFSPCFDVMENFYMSNMLTSAFIIFLLLMVIIFFIRFTYNKGGGLRKDY